MIPWDLIFELIRSLIGECEGQSNEKIRRQLRRPVAWKKRRLECGIRRELGMKPTEWRNSLKKDQIMGAVMHGASEASDKDLDDLIAEAHEEQ